MLLSLRSYAGAGCSARHDFAQLVLPITGAMDVEIDGQQGLLDRGTAAFVDAETRHAECASVRNGFLVFDFDAASIDSATREVFARKRFLDVTPGVRHLIDYMRLTCRAGRASTDILSRWSPLICDRLLQGARGRDDHRMSALKRAMRADPGARWDTPAMAKIAGVSVSRLHALFRSETSASPRAWLTAERIRLIEAWLSDTAEPVAEIALRAGFSDQSAMTRAFRAATGRTPGAYRRATRR